MKLGVKCECFCVPLLFKNIMSRASTYHVKLRKIVCGGVRNIDSYYVVFRSQKQPQKYISRAMRIDEDNEDEFTPQVDIRPTSAQLWNYDKMRLVEIFKLDFKMQPAFTWTVYDVNLQLTVQRRNEWEQEIRNRQRVEEEAEADAASNKGINISSIPPQRSEVDSSIIASNTPSKVASNNLSKAAINTPSKVASNTPSKVVQASQHSQQLKREAVSMQALPQNPKKISDSITKLPLKTGNEVPMESISLIEY